MNPSTASESCVLGDGKTKGQTFEGIAFTFCKAATLILILQKFALPVVSGAAAVFYLIAFWHGQKESRCILKYSLLIATFWGAVAIVSGYRIFAPYFQ